jgi:hypothetical protein
MPCRPETAPTILNSDVVAGAEASASGTTGFTTAGRRREHRLLMPMLLLVMGMMWWTQAAAVAVHGLWLSLSSFDHGEVFLIKTRETFKLADVQLLTARVLLLSSPLDDHEVEPKAEAARTTSWSSCERLALDARTGSSLLRLGRGRGELVVSDSEEYDDDQDNNDGTSTTIAVTTVDASSSLANGPFADQIDWIGQVLVAEESSTAASLVDAIGRQSATWALDRPWTLRYLSMMSSSSSSSSSSDSNVLNSINEKRLLCAVAQSIQNPRAALVEDDQTAQLMIVRVVADPADNDNDDDPTESFYLTQQLATTTMAKNHETTQRRAFRQQWAGRPFPYSSAINYDIAEMVMAMLLQGGRRKGAESSNNDSTSSVVDTPNIIRLLDPTCGSGTFLAVAMMMQQQQQQQQQQGMTVSALWVEGRDSNPACIDGTRRNLEYMLGPAAVSSTCRLVVRDSAKASADTQHDDQNEDRQANHHPTGKFNCLVCNLPWGLNTKSYVNENLSILAAVRTELETGARCIVIWKADPNEFGTSLWRADLKRIGYRVMDQAHVPPPDFRLPTSNKVVGGASCGGPPNNNKQQQQKQPTNHGRSSCVVSVLETT